MEIKTARLLLCPLGTRFLESTHSYVSNIENTRYMVRLPNETIEETREFLLYCENEWKKGKPMFYEFAVLLDNVHIGAVGIYLNDTCDEVELGWIFNPLYHNKGYATEAAMAIINFVKENLKIKHFVAHCDTENYSSEAVMRKLGLVRVSCYGGRRNRISDEERMEYKYEMILQ